MTDEEEYVNDHSSSFGTEMGDGEMDKRVQNERVEEEAKMMAQSETKAVRGLKMLVFLVLALSALAVSLAAYYYAHGEEYSNFETRFDDDATKVLATLGRGLFDTTLAAVDIFMVGMTSYAASTNQTFPFVTIPNFEAKASRIRELSKTIVLSVYPFVASEQRGDWENYGAEHNAWVNQSMQMQARDSSYYGPIVYNYTNWDVIYGNDEYEKEDAGVFGTDSAGPYLPNWQTSPVVLAWSTAYNWDYFTDMDMPAQYAHLKRNHKAIISGAFLIPRPDDPDKNAEEEATADWYKDFLPPYEEVMEPMSDLVYPIIADAHEYDNLHAGGDYNPSEHTLAGFLALSMYWRDLIRGILPAGSIGLLAVFENPCNPTFTYQINGPYVVFLGNGDAHDPKYDAYGVGSTLLELRQFAAQESTYRGIPLDEDFCPFRVTIYPSDEMLAKFTSNNPIIFAVAGALIFTFTFAVFMMYDFWVERRQRLVVRTAQHSNAIVSSLFPSNVRDRAFGTAEENHEKDKAKPVPTFLNNGLAKLRKNGEPEGPSVEEDASLPVADLFPECTVFFCDLVGFTSWSANRTPTEVFILLESIYGAFDKIADRRNVFKVETIGDCYMAVTGLPNPQKRHALIMVKFAAECREKLVVALRGLEEKLGEGTSDLRLRFGLHSGPVTAGVLRGKKARFQLFGDTVNTASRMESNGQANRIHVSEATAKCIRESGKGHWLTQREDLIEAKGKGTLQTYFVEPNAGEGTVSGKSSVGWTNSTSGGSEEDTSVISAMKTSLGDDTEDDCADLVDV